MSSSSNSPTVVPDALSAQWADTYRFLEQRLGTLTAEIEQLRHERESASAGRAALAQRLRSVLDALPGAVVVLSGAGRVQQYNRAAAALLGDPLQDELWREVIARCFAPQASGHDLVLNNGRIVSLSTAPLGVEPGQILLFQDVTDTRHLQESLNRQQRLLDMGQMAANLAHQIRTPLASALLYASQLSRPTLPADTRQRFADSTVASLKRLEQLINNMLLFTRGGVGGEELLWPEALLRELAGNLESQLGAKGIHCEVAAQCGDLRIRANRAVLLSALENLANNAIQAMAGGGVLRLFCRPAAAGSVDLGVHDEGPGVAPEIQARLFEPFSTTRTRGTGLGLAIVRLVAQAHHGEVWFTSQPGDTTFAVRLPAAAASEPRRRADDRYEVA